MKSIIAITLLAGAGVPALAGAQAADNPPPPAIAPAQAKRGEQTFRQTCSNCHATSQFSGPAFVQAWNERPVFELFEQLRSNMPQDNPGGLTRQEYLDVALYLFKLNGAAEGEKELPPDDAVMKATKLKLKTN